MKNFICFIVICFYFTQGYSQEYLSQNEVTLSVTKNNKVYNWKSHLLTSRLIMDRSEWKMNIDVVTLVNEIDSLNRIILFNTNCPTINLNLNFPFNKLDKSIGGRQTFLLQGILNGCGNQYNVNVNVGFQFLDEILMYDFRLKLEAAAIGLTGLKGIDPIVLLHTDSGRLLERAKE